MTPTKKAYERYRLEWMLAHGYTLTDLIKGLEVLRQEDTEIAIAQLFAEWEFNSGFGGEIWSSYQEFMDADCPEISYEEWHREDDVRLDEELELGEFFLTTSTMTVSDPCYDEDVWCKNDLINVLPGTWRATAYQSDEGEWGQRMSILSAVHEDYADDDKLTRSEAPFSVAVDSGQAGFFDAAHYRDSSVIPGYGEIEETEKSELWYRHCCEITLSRLGAGTMPYGVVSTSGYGDGCYGCYIYTNDSGWIVKVEIEFISEEDDDE